MVYSRVKFALIAFRTHCWLVILMPAPIRNIWIYQLLTMWLKYIKLQTFFIIILFMDMKYMDQILVKEEKRIEDVVLFIFISCHI